MYVVKSSQGAYLGLGFWVTYNWVDSQTKASRFVNKASARVAMELLAKEVEDYGIKYKIYKLKEKAKDTGWLDDPDYSKIKHQTKKLLGVNHFTMKIRRLVDNSGAYVTVCNQDDRSKYDLCIDFDDIPRVCDTLMDWWRQYK